MARWITDTVAAIDQVSDAFCSLPITRTGNLAAGVAEPTSSLLAGFNMKALKHPFDMSPDRLSRGIDPAVLAGLDYHLRVALIPARIVRTAG